MCSAFGRGKNVHVESSDLGGWTGARFWNQIQQTECAIRVYYTEMKHAEFTYGTGKSGDKKATCLAQRVGTKSPSRSGALLP